MPERMEIASAAHDALVAAANTVTSNGGSTSYYDVPKHCLTLDDLIEYKKMPFWLGCIFKACYRLGDKQGTSKLYDLNKMLYYVNRGIEQEK